MSSIKMLNPKAEVMSRVAALFMTINAAKGLRDVMATNLGPAGTVKMLVDGAGGIKLTKDGNVLLREMQIQNPTAVMIARAAVAQDDITGDGTTTIVLLIGELMKQAERLVADGTHPRLIVDGFDAARVEALKFLESYARPIAVAPGAEDREALVCVARTALRTKLEKGLADQMTAAVVDAVLTVRPAAPAEPAGRPPSSAGNGDGGPAPASSTSPPPPPPIDLHMVEIMHMRHKLARDSRLVRGLVLDHGARHPDMPKRLEGDVFILTANIGLEYERSEVNAGFFYSSADQRERLVAAERGVTDARVQAVIDLKRRVCTSPAAGFVLVNQKGIDPPALDALAKAGILALRRAKRRNMERLVLACGGLAVNSVEELNDPGVLGRAGLVWEHTLGDEKYTFIEDVPSPKSCTILIKGPDDHTLAQVKDAVRDGLRAVKNAIDDGGVVPGGGAFEAAAARHLRHGGCYASAVGRAKLGVAAFADALLAVPKTLAENAGHAGQDAVLALDAELEAGAEGVGVDLATGTATDTAAAGIWDAPCVKRQILQSAPVVAAQLLLVDEVLRAGANMRKAAGP